MSQGAVIPKNVGLTSAVALGIGGMVGAGLYSMLGLASEHAGTWLPLAFNVGAFAAAFSVYSYFKLGATFPSAGVLPTSRCRDTGTPSWRAASTSSNTSPT